MKRLLVLALIAVSGYAQTDTSTPPAVQTEASAAAWREDFHYLVDQVDRIHPDPYRYTPQSTFETIADAVDQHIPELTDPQIIVEFMRYTAMITDGHTSFFPAFQTAYPFSAYPLLFYLFSDGVYLVGAVPDEAQYIGAQLVSVGGHDVDDVLSRIGRLVQHDNDSGRRILIPFNMVAVEVLLGAGVIDDPAQPDFVLELPDHTMVTLNLDAVPVADFVNRFPSHYRLSGDSAVPSRAHLSESLWWMPLDDAHTLYVQYNEVRSLGNQLAELQEAFRAMDADRLILDLRYNGGGDINTGRRFYEWLQSEERLQESCALTVLIGRNTFSAAVVFSLWLEQNLHPVFMGEPTGGRPLMFENNRPVTLPNSGLQVFIATRARRDVESSDLRAAIEPEVSLPLTSADYFAGRDPVLDAAEDYPCPVT